MKKISVANAVSMILNGEEVFMAVKITKNNFISDLENAQFCFIEEAEPKPTKSIDHGKLVALFNAGWTVKNISDELGCSLQTVVNHLKKDGLWRETQ